MSSIFSAAAVFGSRRCLHRPASSSTKRAGSVHVPGRRVAKAVLIKAGDSFVLAVLPSTSRIDLVQLSEVVGEPASQVRLATRMSCSSSSPTVSRASSRRSGGFMGSRPSSIRGWRIRPRSSWGPTPATKDCACSSATSRRWKNPSGRRLLARSCPSSSSEFDPNATEIAGPVEFQFRQLLE